MANVVQTDKLARRFGRRWAYAHVDLRVEDGQRVLIAGANGSGKTTLLRTLATALMPSQGELTLFGMGPDQRWELRKRIGMLSHATGLYEDLSAGDNLVVYGRIIARAVPKGLLAQVGLDGRTEPVRTYSAGMRKRLAMAVLLLQDPDLVLLDEPYGQLDPAGMDQMTRLIAQVRGTVIISSHQLERAGELCDHALLLDAGLPRWQGPARNIVDAWQKVHDAKAVAS